MYNNFYNLNVDPRSAEWPLMGSPITIVCVIVFYYLMATSFGPNLMKNRKPFAIKKIIVTYNILQIIWNFYVTCYVSLFYNNNFNVLLKKNVH